MRVASVMAMLVLAGCGWLGSTDPGEPDNRAETLEALAAEMGWRPESFVVADDGTAYRESRAGRFGHRGRVRLGLALR